MEAVCAHQLQYYALTRAIPMPGAQGATPPASLARVRGGGGFEGVEWLELALQTAVVFCVWFVACTAVLKAAERSSGVLERTARRRGNGHREDNRSSTRDGCAPPSAGRKPTGRSAVAEPVAASSAAAGPGADRRGPRPTYQQGRKRPEGDLASPESRQSQSLQRLQRRASGTVLVGKPGAAVDAVVHEGDAVRAEGGARGKTSPTRSPSTGRSESDGGARNDFLTSSVCWRIDETQV